MGIFRRFRTLAADRRRRLAANQRDLGATAVEYGLILALFGIGMIGVSGILFGAIRTTMGVQSTNVGNTVAVAVVPPGGPAGGTTCNAGGVWDGTTCVSICLSTQWYNAGTGACDPIPTCTGATPIYQPLNNTCVADTSGGGPPTPPVGTTCPTNGWYNPNTGNCDQKTVCPPTGSPSQTVWNSLTNSCQTTGSSTPTSCTGTNVNLGTSCISQTACTNSPNNGVVVNTTCVTQTTCQNAGSAWVTTPSRACITQFQCTSTLVGVWTPKSGSVNATCTTQQQCEANLANAWVGSPRSCVTSAQCTATTGTSPMNGIWTAGTGPGNPSKCTTQASCNAAGNAWLGGTTKYCVTQAQCTATTGTTPQTGIWYSGNPPTCVTQTTCTAAGSAWVPGAVGTRACISPAQCRGVMAGIFTPAAGGTPASCMTAATCNAQTPANSYAWIPGNQRYCVNQATCEASSGSGGQSGKWNAGTPPTCTTQTTCEAAGSAWVPGSTPATRYCISPANSTTCTNAPVSGIWNAGPPPTCTTQAMCTGAGNIWTPGTPPSCRTPQDACEFNGNAWTDGTCRTSGQCATAGMFWIAGTPNTCVVGAACPGQVATATGCTAFPAPPAPPQRDNDDGPTAIPLVPAPYNAPPYTVTINDIDACTKSWGGGGGSNPSCTADAPNINLSSPNNRTGTVTIRYDITISWTTGSTRLNNQQIVVTVVD